MPDSQENLNGVFSLAIDVIRLGITLPVDEVTVKNVYVDVDDVHIRVVPFEFTAEIDASGLIVNLPPTTLGSIYEIQLLSQGKVVLSAYFDMPKNDCFLSDLPLYTAFPPRESYPVDEVNWGDIKGDFVNQTDLSSLIFTATQANQLKQELTETTNTQNTIINEGLSDISEELSGQVYELTQSTNTKTTQLEQKINTDIAGVSSEITTLDEKVLLNKNQLEAKNVELQNQINANGGGKFAYTAYAKMEAAAALPAEDPLKLPANSSIDVTNDPDLTKNGTYAYDGTVFTKSPYDPLTLSKGYTDAKIEIDDTDTENIVNVKDANGISLMRTDIDGKHWFHGIDDDLKTALDNSATNTLIALEESETIAEIRDSNNTLTFKQTLDGDIHAVGTGNISQAIRELKSGTNSTDSALDAKYLAGKYADYTLAETIDSYKDVGSLLTATQVDALGLFTHPVGVIRIPTITRIGKTKYLLFYEARESFDDYGTISQGVVTLNIDPVTLAPTLSNHQSLGDGYIDVADKLWTFMYGCGLKLASGRIICMYVERQKNFEHKLITRYSDDDGVTWSAPEDISYVKGGFTNGMLPCSQGLEKRFGQHVGRIVFPVWTSGVNYTVSDFRATYIYSDDGGLTWLRGEEAPYGTGNEVQIAEDLNGDMLFAIRLQNKTPAKIIARHSDKTKEYRTVEVNKSLTDEKIMSGLIQGDNLYDFSAAKFILSTCLTESRTTLLIHTSYDGGVNWRTHMLPEALNQPVGYTCIESISASHKLIIWEADGLVNLDYTIISLNTLIAGA
jgi:sialidase-1